LFPSRTVAMVTPPVFGDERNQILG
jgi:hypothetical protein